VGGCGAAASSGGDGNGTQDKGPCRN